MNYVTDRPSFSRDLLMTMATGLASALALLVMTRWLAINLGPEEFGAFATGRRLALFLAPLVTCSIAMSLTRVVAASRLQSATLYHLLAGATLFVLAVLTILGLIASLAQRHISTVLFPGTAQDHLLLASLAYLGMMALHAIWVAYLRGIGAVRRGNRWTLGLLGAQMMLAWAQRDGSATRFLFLSAALAVPHLLAIAYALRPNGTRVTLRGLTHALGSLLRFGWLRAPGTLLLDSVGLLTQILVARQHGFAAAIPFAVSYMIMRLADTVISPLSITLLSRTESVVTQLDTDRGAMRLTAILEMLADLPLFFTLQSLIWLDVLLETWLGSTSWDGLPLCRLILLGLFPYTWILFGRGLLDTIDPYPWATRYLVIATLITGAGTIALTMITPLPWALAMGSTLLLALFGGLLWRHLHVRFGYPHGQARLWRVLWVNLLFAVPPTVIAWQIHGHPLGLRLAIGSLTTGLLAAAYLRWSLPTATTWPAHLRQAWQAWRPAV